MKVSIFATAILVGANAMANRQGCDLWRFTPHFQVQNRLLSENWAAEYIGADLAKNEFTREISIPQNFIMVADTPVRDHKDLVANLIVDDGPQAVLAGNNQKSVLYVPFSQMPKPALAPPSVRYINNSMGWENSRSRDNLLEFARNGIHVFVAAGNDSTDRTNVKIEEPIVRAAKDGQIFIVGSISPFGGASEFSQGDETVAVSAPSDDYIVSRLLGRPNRFRGTSGATPLVTASVAQFELITGYPPTHQEIHTVLKLTSMPMPYETNRQIGVGMINSYKIAAVANRLKFACGQNARCYEQALRNTASFQFAQDTSLQDWIKQDFPFCVQNTTAHQNTPVPINNCNSAQETFSRLRQAAFLNPTDKNLWKTIACIHRWAGLSSNALHYYRLAGDVYQASIQKGEVIRKYYDSESVAGKFRMMTELWTPDLSQRWPYMNSSEIQKWVLDHPLQSVRELFSAIRRKDQNRNYLLQAVTKDVIGKAILSSPEFFVEDLLHEKKGASQIDYSVLVTLRPIINEALEQSTEVTNAFLTGIYRRARWAEAIFQYLAPRQLMLSGLNHPDTNIRYLSAIDIIGVNLNSTAVYEIATVLPKGSIAQREFVETYRVQFAKQFQAPPDPVHHRKILALIGVDEANSSK